MPHRSAAVSKHRARLSTLEALALKARRNIEGRWPRAERRFQAFGVGLPRSGTHSLAYMFDLYYRAGHEPVPERAIGLVLQWERGEISREALVSALLERDRLLGLHLEASHYLHHVAGELAETFPRAKFLLTVREPGAWLESEVNQNRLSRDSGHYRALEQHRYSRYGFAHEFGALEALDNVYPVRAYLTYWVDHISKVLRAVPSERLLVVDTHDLRGKMAAIAAFVGVPERSLHAERQHSGMRVPETDLYALVDRKDVDAHIEAICGDFIRKTFPAMAERMAARS